MMWRITSSFAFTFLALLSLSSLSASQAARPVTLPAPTGINGVGTIEIELTDTSRTDSLAPNPSVPRSFMVQILYPTKKSENPSTRAPYMRAAAAAFHENYYGFPNGSISSIRTNSYRGASISLPDNTANVILFSPGFQYSRIFYTSLAEELASHGYIVVAIDHTYDATAVEFPDGRLVTSAFLNITDAPKQVSEEQLVTILDARINDVNFTMNTLLGTRFLRQIPGIGRRVRLGGIGMYGHSLGGATAAEVALFDKRILGGLNMDGTFYGNVVTTGLNKPFFVMGAGVHNSTNDPSWQTMWDNLHGWKQHVQLTSGEHMTYSDFSALIELLGIGPTFSPGYLETRYGTIDGVRAVVAERAYAVAFFDFLLKRRSDIFLDSPSPSYPEITFPSSI